MSIRSQARAGVERWTAPAVPARLRRNWRLLRPSDRVRLVAALEAGGGVYDRSVTGLADHVDGRLDAIRRTVVPWLDDAVPLRGAVVLEVGCGTGSTTVALAEQGARVVGLDLRADRVEATRARCALHGVRAEVEVGNALDLARHTDGLDVDLVVFTAVLEHMTLDERLGAMATSWAMLRPGAHWMVTDTPNRLWVRDRHTSHLPFFHWLPDELAVRYAGRSPRPELASLGGEPTPAVLEDLVRQGRGVSYHEFDLAMGRAEDLEVVSTLTDYRDRHSLARRVLRRRRPDRRVELVLRREAPPIHRGFLEESLNLVLRKP